MNNKLMIFEGKEVEVFELDGIIYFNPYHVGECLNIGKSAIRDHLSKMNENQARLIKNSDVALIDTQNSDVDSLNFRKLNNAGEKFLTESGVYKLIFKSRKPKAEKFTDWVTDEVLPTIRKEGKYITESVSKSSSTLLNTNLLQQEKEKLNKAVITSNYLIDYVVSGNCQIPDTILDSFTTAIQAVNIDIIDRLRNMNKLQYTKSH